MKRDIIWIALTGQNIWGAYTVGVAHGYYGSGRWPD
jgi:hypothetical protein